MRTTIKLLCIGLGFGSTLLFPNAGKAQNLTLAAKNEKINTYWQLAIQQTKAMEQASSQEFDVFNRFYSKTIDSIHTAILRETKKSNMGLEDSKAYVLSKRASLIDLFNNFKKIEQEFPTSVDEYKNPPKFRPAGDSCYSSCNNTGFEDGNLGGWYGYYGVNNSGSAFNITNITGGYAGPVQRTAYDLLLPDAPDYQIRLTGGATLDPFLQAYSTYSMPEVSPWGGRHSVMLGDSAQGDDSYPGQGTAILSQSFLVTAANSTLTYQYSLFLENPTGHSYYEQPFFSVAVLDQLGDTIPTCGLYQVDAQNAGANGFIGIFYPNEFDTVYWKNWTLVNVPLKKYIGQCVTIVFQVQDCSLGGHFGYAYVDATCSPAGVLSSSPNFCGQDSIMLTAPPGASSYRWTGPNGGIRGSDSGQNVSIDSAGIYRVVTVPVTGATCADTIYDTIGKLPVPFPHPKFTTNTVCAGTPTTFTNISSPINGVFSWDFYNIGIYNYSNMSGDDTSWIYASGGTYFVKLHELSNGCGLDTVEKVVVDTPVGPISHTQSPFCAGDSTLFTASANTNNYAWNFGDPGSGPLNTSNLQNTGHVYHTAGTYSVTIRGLGQCEVDTTFPVIIIASPTPIVTGDTSICVNTQDVLTATGGSSYLWQPGNHTGSTYTVTPAHTMVYTLTATSGACSGTTTFTVSTYSPPAPTITPAHDTVCPGATVVLNGSGTGVYKWSTGSTSTTITVNPNVTTIYELRDSVKGSECESTTTVTVVVRTPVKASISHDTSICPKQPVTLSVTESGEPPYYIWSTTATGSSINVAPSTTTTYSVLVSGLYCDHDTFSTTVNVVQLPVPVIAGPIWECSGITDTLTVTSSVNPTTYQWYNGSTDSSIVTGGIYADSIISVTAYNSLGCPATTTYTVNLLPPPTATVTPMNIFCAGQAISLSATAAGLDPNPPFTYTWSTGQNGSSITINPGPDSATTYTVFVSNGCTGQGSTTVVPNIPVLYACCNQTLYIEHDSTNRHDTTILVASGNSKQYQWQENPNSGTITCLDPLCDSIMVVTYVTTTYTVTGTDSNGCQTEQILMVNIDIPCFDLVVPNVITPNMPGPLGLNDKLYIKTEDINAWNITIFNRWGKEVYNSTDQYQYWNGTNESGAKVEDGVYYYVINATCQNTTYKKDGFIQLIR